MCTVSFVRINDAVMITSNRDEHIQREKAGAPGIHLLPGKRIIFPKDAKAGGTWFAAADNGTAAVLLNGAFSKHISNPPYRKSRGLILLEIIKAEDPLTGFREMDLENIEPFTVILYQTGSLSERCWDGNNKHERSLNSSGNYIWSSTTLYTDEVIERRKFLFDQFIQLTENITAERVHDFHNYGHADEENGFIINRKTGVRTFSITQAVIRPGTLRFLHTDLLLHQQFEETMSINKATIRS